MDRSLCFILSNNLLDFPIECYHIAQFDMDIHDKICSSDCYHHCIVKAERSDDKIQSQYALCNCGSNVEILDQNKYNKTLFGDVSIVKAEEMAQNVHNQILEW